jgi:hypothetical protein
MATYVEDIDPSLDEDQQADEEQKIRQDADDRFWAILEALSDDAKAELDLEDGHRTRAVSEREHTVVAWRLSWKLEWGRRELRRRRRCRNSGPIVL